MIVACAVLHNLALQCDTAVPDKDPNLDMGQEDEVPAGPPMWHQLDGSAMRNSLIEGIFDVEKKEPLFTQM